MKLFTKIFLITAIISTMTSCSTESWTTDNNKSPETSAIIKEKTPEPATPNEIESEEIQSNKIGETDSSTSSNEESVDASGISKEELLAQCLKEKWAKIFWTEWCSHCKRQKSMFWVKGIEILWFTDCDKERQVCVENWIKWYPTWIINWESLPWVRDLSFLANKTWCKY